MKKIFIIFICLVFACCGGCKKNKDSSEDIEYIYDKVKETNEEYTDEELEKIQTGITQWAEGFLLVGSNATEEEKRLIRQSFDKCIVSDEEREKVEEDRQKFYKDSYVKIGLVDTTIANDQKVQYEDEEMGKITCTINVYGTRNNNRFQRTYHLDLLITFQDDVSIREIDKISWESVEY